MSRATGSFMAPLAARIPRLEGASRWKKMPLSRYTWVKRLGLQAPAASNTSLRGRLQNPTARPPWRVGTAVESTALEMRHTGNQIGGFNPSLWATLPPPGAPGGGLALLREGALFPLKQQFWRN